MTESADARVAVYIDFDNIIISRYDQVHGRSQFMRDKARGFGGGDAENTEKLRRATVDIGAVIDFASSFGTLVLTRAYADWSASVNADYRGQLVGRAVDLVQLFPAAAYAKNGADIRLAVDAIEDMFRLPDLTHVVIVAGDSDYIALAQRCKRLGRYVVGIGVGVPGPVDIVSARLASPQIDPQWNGISVRDYFSGRYDHAVFAVDRDVNTLALAEARKGGGAYEHLVVLKAGMGLGLGYVLDGAVYRGARGGAGDLSAPRIDGGRLQRLEDVASGAVIRRNLAERGHKVRTSADIVRLAGEGDALTLALLEDAGTTIGRTVADIVGLLNPQTVVVGGHLAEAGESFLQPIREAIFGGVRDFARQGLTVEASRLAHMAGITGASLLAQDTLFDADRVSRLTYAGVTL